MPDLGPTNLTFIYLDQTGLFDKLPASSDSPLVVPSNEVRQDEDSNYHGHPWCYLQIRQLTAATCPGIRVDNISEHHQRVRRCHPYLILCRGVIGTLGMYFVNEQTSLMHNP